MNSRDPEFAPFLGQQVVLDVSSPYVYIGTLADIQLGSLLLENADVHDLRDSKTTRELYVIDAKRHGLNVNRKRVLIRRDEIISLSLLSDIVE